MNSLNEVFNFLNNHGGNKCKKKDSNYQNILDSGKKSHFDWKSFSEDIVKKINLDMEYSIQNWNHSGNIYNYFWTQFKAKNVKSASSISVFARANNQIEVKLTWHFTYTKRKNIKLSNTLSQHNSWFECIDDFKNKIKKSKYEYIVEWEEYSNSTSKNSDYASLTNTNKLDELKKNIKNRIAKNPQTFLVEIEKKFDCKNINLDSLKEEISITINELEELYIKALGSPTLKSNHNENTSKTTLVPNNLPKETSINNDKNIILYGPPGTGKTYNLVNYSVSIITGEDLRNVQSKPYNEVLQKYNELKEEGRIAFTTFHQSYSYEEFIEGIKPVINCQDDNAASEVRYEYSDGVFKKFCENAKQVTIQDSTLGIAQTPVVWNVLLGGPGSTNLKKECFENSYIKIGWANVEEGKVMEESQNLNALKRRILVNFESEMKEGDIVFVQKDNSTIDGIGIITGPCEFLKDDREYPRKRNVRWVAKEINKNVLNLNQNIKLDRKSVYPLKRMNIKDVISLIELYSENEKISVKDNTRPYVFIIDEINRGNVSKIFGELITLIEDTKRLSEPEGMTAKLPYTGDEFGVPQNVYILGTMNTADRSIALMDTALRRRFQFIEIMPDSDVLGTIGADKVGDLDVAAMLDKINERIGFLYDREHTIGHAFFTGLKDDPSIERLQSIFEKSIIPLLQEYFYEDYQKIQMVLGDDGKDDPELKFIKDDKIVAKSIFKGSVEDVIDLPEKKYTINKKALSNIQSYIEIL
jgi:SpoVK/Ycf46/Vps4 family AAA+-type ATPase